MATPESYDLPPDPALDARLTELRNRFKAVLPQRMGTIQQRVVALQPGSWDSAVREELKNEVHSLAGSAGLFGFDQIGAAAGELERLIMRVSKQPAASPADMIEIQDAATRLEAAVHAA